MTTNKPYNLKSRLGEKQLLAEKIKRDLYDWKLVKKSSELHTLADQAATQIWCSKEQICTLDIGL